MFVRILPTPYSTAILTSTRNCILDKVQSGETQFERMITMMRTIEEKEKGTNCELYQLLNRETGSGGFYNIPQWQKTDGNGCLGWHTVISLVGLKEYAHSQLIRVKWARERDFTKLLKGKETIKKSLIQIIIWHYAEFEHDAWIFWWRLLNNREWHTVDIEVVCYTAFKTTDKYSTSLFVQNRIP